MMRALDLDFQSRRRGGTLAGVVLLAAGLGAAGATTAWYLRLGQASAALEAQIDALSTRPVPARASGTRESAENRAAALRGKARRELAERLAVPWQVLLDDLEAATDPDVAVLGLQPLPQQHQLRLSGEARDRHALERYLQRLAARPSLSAVYLASHEYGKEQPPERPGAPAHRPGLRFSVTARWNFDAF